MKRVLLLAVMVVMVCSPLAVSYAEDEIYWEGNTPAEPTITDKDFTLDFKVPAAKSLGDLEIYDQPKDIFEGDESAGTVAPNAPVATAEPQLRPAIQPRSLTRPSVEAAPPAPRATPRASEIIPQPAETTPGSNEATIKRRQRSPSTQVQQSNENSSTSTSASAEELDRAGQKKMKWGQTDVKPAEPKGKFQWGRQ
jgi:hypothetical protein